MSIKLGSTVTDKVTGFTGIATGRFEYINGCVRYCVERGKDDGGVEELHFDQERLEVSTRLPVDVTPTPTGGARPTPPRTGAR